MATEYDHAWDQPLVERRVVEIATSFTHSSVGAFDKFLDDDMESRDRIIGMIDELQAFGYHNLSDELIDMMDSALAAEVRSMSQPVQPSRRASLAGRIARRAALHGRDAATRVTQRRSALGKPGPVTHRPGIIAKRGGALGTTNQRPQTRDSRPLRQPQQPRLTYAPDGVLVVDGVRSESHTRAEHAAASARARVAAHVAPQANRRDSHVYNIQIGPSVAPPTEEPSEVEVDPVPALGPNPAPGTTGAGKAIGAGWVAKAGKLVVPGVTPN